MTKDEFKVLVKAMKATYAQETFLPDKDAFDVWYALLSDLPYKQAALAVQKYMSEERFPPTIADIREKATQIITPETDELNEMQAWDLVYKAICKSGYNSKEEFDKLPTVIQKAVGSPTMLYEWSMMDEDTVKSVEQSHFIRNYRSEMDRANREAKLPPNLLNAIKKMKLGAQIGENNRGAISEREE